MPGASALTLAPHDAVARQAWAQHGGVPATPQERNRYAYARNNPLRWTDPTGHHPCVALLAGGPVGAGVAASCALFFLGVAAVGSFTGEAIRHAVEEGQGLPPLPLSSDTGGQLASPGGLDPDDPNDLENLVANKGQVEIRERTQQGTGQGTTYEEYVRNLLGATRGFEARRASFGQFKDFDGAYQNGTIWFEAKSGVWSQEAIIQFRSQAGEQIKIAHAAGRQYQLISREPIPDAVKQWLINRGAFFREIP